MTALLLIAALFCGIVLVGVLYAAAALLGSLCKGRGSALLFPLASLPFVLALFLLSPRPLIGFTFLTPWDASVWIGASAAVLAAAGLTFFLHRGEQTTVAKLFGQAAAGSLMELPQRLLLQNFLYLLLLIWELPHAALWSVVLNALVWCGGIAAQALLTRERFSLHLFLEGLASLLFSLGIGLAFFKSGCILLAVAAHFLERLLSRGAALLLPLQNKKIHI